MLNDFHSLSLLTLMEIIGPVVLALGLWYGIARSRRSKASQRASDRATRDLYEKEEPRASQKLGGASQGGAHTVPDPHTRGV
jgi:hypothetical protein